MTSRELYDIIVKNKESFKIYHLLNSKSNLVSSKYYYYISDNYQGIFEIYKLSYEYNNAYKFSIRDFTHVDIIDISIFHYDEYDSTIYNVMTGFESEDNIKQKIEDLVFRLI